MSRKISSAMLVLSLAAVLGVFVGNASADAIYTYDFSRVSPTFAGPPVGLLDGQDGWYAGSTQYEYVIVGTGQPGWTGNYAQGTNAALTNEQQFRPSDANFPTVPDNTSFDFSCLVLVNGIKYTSLGGLNNATFGGTIKSLGVGVFDVSGVGELEWAINGVGYYDSAAVAARSGNNDQFLVGQTWTYQGTANQYSVQRYYQDLTTNPNGTPTLDGSPIVLTIAGGHTASQSFTSLCADCRALGALVGTERLDLIGVSPEPSTLALLATGLIGLLCCAWRKRR